MSEYIIWESDKTEITDNLGVKHSVSHFEKRGEIVRCSDCAKFYNGDADYGTDDWCQEFSCQIEPTGFCAWAERREP